MDTVMVMLATKYEYANELNGAKELREERKRRKKCCESYVISILHVFLL